ERTSSFRALLDFIAEYYNCQVTDQSSDKSDLNDDGVVDLADLIIFGANYLETNWEAVDWCLFYDSTVAREDFDGRSTKYYLKHFGRLLEFINDYFGCSGGGPPPGGLLLENVPRDLARVAAATNGSGDYYITDPSVGSLFIYDANLVLKGEIKGLNQPLGVVVDSWGRILIGNDGRDNVEVYDAINGELLAVLGEGLIKMPNAITMDDLGNIYVVDSLLNNVRMFDPDYNLVKTIGRAGAGPTELNFPVDVEIVAAGSSLELFVADQGNYRVQVFDLDGNWLRSIAWLGDCGWFSCTTPPFKIIQAIDTDSFGRLHVLDKLGATAFIFDPVDGTFQDLYGGYGTEPGTLTLPIDLLISATDT
ncbi:MAG: hypothetical protein GTO41_01865, partial [Burkholderiales bacterium]|nr:hypothetical protein [Burkholderiales bacterium]